MKVLVADDFPDIAEVFSELSPAYGHSPMAVTNAAAALEAARSFRPELVFLDISLGDADGVEVCRRLREHCPAPACKIVAMSGYADAVKGAEGLFDGFLLKPISVREFERWVPSN